MGKKSRSHSLQKTNTSNIITAFVILSFVCMMLSIELAVITDGVSIRDSLFWNEAYSDHFMDFFNTLRDSHDLTWVYQRGTIYPPLSVLIMYMFSLLIPSELAALPFSDRYEMQFSQTAVMLFFIVALICVALLAKFIDSYMQNSGIGRIRYLVVFFTIISFPLVYCAERGNTSLIALVGCAFFLFFRNSESKAVREISYIALALAAGLKMFPAFFGVLLLYDRKYKAAVRTVIYGIAALVVPYVIVKLITPESGLADAVIGDIAAGNMAADTNTDGSAARFFQNLLKWVNKKDYFTFNSTSISNIAYLLNSMSLMSAEHASTLAMAAFVVTEIVAFVAGFFCKKDWQKMFCACYLMLNIHAVAMHYTLVYLIPVFIAFLCDKGKKGDGKRSGADIVYFILFACQIITIPNLLYSFKTEMYVFVYFHLQLKLTGDFNKTVSVLMFQLLFAVMLLDLIVSAVKDHKENQSEGKRKVRSKAPRRIKAGA